MPRQTIDFGIDLGTTNSAVAAMQDGRPLVIRNPDNEHRELTASCVMIERNGTISVGERAYRQAEVRPQSVAREFKRGMGTTQTYPLGGHAMTPEDLSAKVLEALVRAAEDRVKEKVRAAVITVPAMFTLAACDATVRAAKLAGIDQAPLLQEPIAAGLAYGFQQSATSGCWMVYDLGGGTFDCSLMMMRDGRLQVIDHAGDEFLGGRNFDDLLIDHVVERLQDEYSIEGTVRAVGQRRLLYARLKLACEDAKIRLSQADKTEVELANVSDDEGMPIDTYIEVTRSTYNKLIEPLVTKTTELAAGLLEHNGLDARAVQRIIMVGGPTYTPLIRRKVQEDLGIAIETRIDPMSVVAQGAAIYAGSILVERPATTSSRPGEIRLQIKYNPVSEDSEALVGGRVDSEAQPGLRVVIERQDGGWSSGQVPVSNSTFVVRVTLRENVPNLFRLSILGPNGARLPATPDHFTITHGLVVDDPPLSRSLGIAVDNDDRAQRTLIMLPHGTRLPTTKVTTVRTKLPAGPDLPAALAIHIVEGEAERADRNDHVGFIRLDSSNLRRSLPVASDIEITFSMDTSRVLTVKAFVPVLDETYNLLIRDMNRPVPDARVLATEYQAEAGRIAEIGAVTSVGHVAARTEELEKALDEAGTGDADAALRAQRQLRALQVEIDSLAAEADFPLLESEWLDIVPKTERVVREYGTPAHQQQFDNARLEGNQALASRDQLRLRRRVEEITNLYWVILVSQPGWWIGYYQYLADEVDSMSDKLTAQVLLRDGRQALDRQDFEALQRVCRRLYELMPKSEGSASGGLPDVNIRA